MKNYGKIKENMKGVIVCELLISDRFLLWFVVYIFKRKLSIFY